MRVGPCRVGQCPRAAAGSPTPSLRVPSAFLTFSQGIARFSHTVVCIPRTERGVLGRWSYLLCRNHRIGRQCRNATRAILAFPIRFMAGDIFSLSHSAVAYGGRDCIGDGHGKHVQPCHTDRPPPGRSGHPYQSGLVDLLSVPSKLSWSLGSWCRRRSARSEEHVWATQTYKHQ